MSALDGVRVDSLLCTRLDRETLLELRSGDIGCVTITAGFWEDATESMDSLVRWGEMVRENSDLAEIATSVDQIRQVAASGRTAIVLGFQNSSLLQGRLGYVELFARMGVRVVQLTYNIQNDIGGSCYDPHDSGLTRYGREVVQEMNRVGMVVDCSHVGNRTTLDAIEVSSVPIAVTHANPASLVPHARNKPDEVLRALAATGGMFGLTIYRNLAAEYVDTPVRWSEMVARTADVMGVEHIGIGTDMDQRSSAEYLTWMRKGRWTRQAQTGAGSSTTAAPTAPPSWFRNPAEFGAFEQALHDRGFTADETAGVLGENWLRYYAEVFGETAHPRRLVAATAAGQS